MKINEIEELLAISKANIRFYEKEGLLNPKRAANGYRDYGEEDVTRLKKIVILRKMGMGIPEIRKIFDGELPLQEALAQNCIELEKQLAELNGAMNLCKTMEKDKSATEDFDEGYYWNLMQDKVSQGEKFVDMVSDYMEFQKKSLIAMWEGPFLYPLGESVRKNGWLIALGILFLICVVRGLARELLGWGSFLEGFGYPFVLFGLIAIITLPLYLINLKYKKVEFEEETKTQSKRITAWKVIGVLLYLPVVCVGGVLLGSKYITDPLIGNISYVIDSKLAILYFVVTMYLFCVCIWLYGKHGIFANLFERGEGFKAHLPKKVKRKVLFFSIIVYVMVTISLSMCFDCVTENGVQRRIFFYTKEYTWEDLECYKLTASLEGMLKYTLVMKDGVQVNCIGGTMGDYNLPEDKYPNDVEDFCIELTKKFKEMGIEPQDTDFEKLEKKLDYGYWAEYAEKLRLIIEE